VRLQRNTADERRVPLGYVNSHTIIIFGGEIFMTMKMLIPTDGSDNSNIALEMVFI